MTYVSITLTKVMLLFILALLAALFPRWVAAVTLVYIALWGLP